MLNLGLPIDIKLPRDHLVLPGIRIHPFICNGRFSRRSREVLLVLEVIPTSAEAKSTPDRDREDMLPACRQPYPVSTNTPAQDVLLLAGIEQGGSGASPFLHKCLAARSASMYIHTATLEWPVPGRAPAGIQLLFSASEKGRWSREQQCKASACSM